METLPSIYIAMVFSLLSHPCVLNQFTTPVGHETFETTSGTWTRNSRRTTDTWTTVNTLMDTFCIPMALMTTTGPLCRYSPPHPYVMVNQIYEDDVRCVPSTLNPKPFPHTILVNPRIPISSSSSEAIFFSIDFLSGCSPSSGSYSSIAWLFFFSCGGPHCTTINGFWLETTPHPH